MCRGCAGRGGMCRLRVSGAPTPHPNPPSHKAPPNANQSQALLRRAPPFPFPGTTAPAPQQIPRHTPVAIMTVLQLPPSESRSTCVMKLLRYGMWSRFPSAFSDNAVMTCAAEGRCGPSLPGAPRGTTGAEPTEFVAVRHKWHGRCGTSGGRKGMDGGWPTAVDEEATRFCSCFVTTCVSSSNPIQSLDVPSPSLVVPHPLSFPGWGWGTVTWSTQKFSLRLIVLLCR